MKIAIHNPIFIFENQEKNFNGYNFEFLKNYVDIICLTKPWHIFKYKKRLKELNVDKKFDFIFTVSALNQKADVLISFTGRPYLKHFSPPKKFSGLKIYHTMDYVFKAQEANESLVKGGVDFVMGYSRHDLYCPFFQAFYKDFKNRVLLVPFGYGKRFVNKTSIEKRVNKCIALGSVNPVDDPLCDREVLKDYIEFYKNEVWTHKFRQIIRENLDNLKNLVDSKLPSMDKTKNLYYDPVEELNKYMFFVNDEGLMNFPPARTYEGIASGCIMIASQNKIYEDLGFKDGENYIAFEKNNLEDFKDKLKSAINGEYDIKKIWKNSLELSKKYSHPKVAEYLYLEIQRRFK